MLKPISTIPEGESAGPVPLAVPPIVRSEFMMSVAKVGPLVSSHQKKPVKIVKHKKPLPASNCAVALFVAVQGVPGKEKKR